MFIEAAIQTDAPTTTDAPASEGDLAGERDLVARLRSGDHAAFEQLVRDHSHHLLAVTRRYLSCAADADDAVQDAFAAAFANIHRFKGESRVSTWLHRIAVNAALMSRRRQSRRRESVLGDHDPDALRQARDQTSEAPPEDALSAREDRGLMAGEAAALLSTIRELPECHREVMELRHVLHQSTQQASAALGITPGALKAKLHRAKAHLLLATARSARLQRAQGR